MTKLRIPDPGPDETDLAAEEAPAWKPLDIKLLAPVDQPPGDQIAERPTEILTVSDEQPFAVSDDGEEDYEPFYEVIVSVEDTDLDSAFRKARRLINEFVTDNR
jgi:hypothetical protein